MESECPSCHKKIEHEDFLFEVQCQHCKTRFNPFMEVGADAGLENLSGAAGGAAEPSAMTGGAPAGPPGESESMFQEIRDYGENLGTPNETPIMPPAETTPVARQMGAPAASTAPLAEGDECPMTAADGMQGFAIEAYFAPLSAMCELQAGTGNPMKAAFDQLSVQAKSMGANAVLSVRWLLSPDGSRVVVTGTPVRCTKT